MEKFTDSDMEALREIVRVELNRSHHLRFGQALWNAAHDLRPSVMDTLRGTRSDFFYIQNPAIAWEIFVTHYTEQGEQSGESNQSDSDGSHGVGSDRS